MRATILSIALLLFASAGCRPHATQDGGTNGDGGPTPRPDANVHPTDTNVPHGDANAHHFDPCTDDSQCPTGDLCSIAYELPIRGDTTAPTQCRPPCAADVDCVAPLVGITYAAQCAMDGFCQGLCASDMSAPPCMTPYACHIWVGYEDGYCVLPTM